MDVALNDLLVSKPGFTEFLANKEIPILISYRVNKLIDEVNPELERFEKTKNELIKKYGEEKKKKDSEETYVEVKPENIQTFFAEMEALSKEVVKLKYEPFNIAKACNAEDIKKIKLSFDNQRPLEKFFTGWDEAIALMS